MADCDEIMEELYPFLDGELTPEAKVAIRRHLDDCLDCLHVFDFHAELRLVIARKCREHEIPAGLLDRVKECFGEQAAP
jgi:mycothiol system anti-sigma-R factor